MDSYQILGVSKDVSNEELKNRLKELMLAYQNIANERKKCNFDNWYEKCLEKRNEYQKKLKESKEKTDMFITMRNYLEDIINKTNKSIFDINPNEIVSDEINGHYRELVESFLNLSCDVHRYYNFRTKKIILTVSKKIKRVDKVDIEQEREDIITLLENVKDIMVSFYCSCRNTDAFFNIDFPEKEVKILQSINRVDFDCFIKNLQKFQKEGQIILEMRKNNFNKIDQLKKRVEMLKQMRQKVAEATVLEFQIQQELIDNFEKERCEEELLFENIFELFSDYYNPTPECTVTVHF